MKSFLFVNAVEHISGTLHTIIQDDFELKSSNVTHFLSSDKEETYLMDFEEFPHLE
jgi:hypothetical protein